MNSPLSTVAHRQAYVQSPRRNFESHRIHLHGFVEYDYTSALQFYRPTVQSYSPPGLKQPVNGAGLGYVRTAPLIEHLDVCTVLKGLLLADAEIMLTIDKVFRTSLEDLLAGQLQRLEWKARQELSSYNVENSHGTVAAVPARMLRFKLNELVVTILKRMQLERRRWDGTWCQSSLLVHVLQYLTTRDCLVDLEPHEYDDMAVQIRMHNVGIPRPIAEVIRSPDFLCFEQLDPLPREGQPIRIIPRYRHGAFDGPEDVNATIEYTIEPAVPWLTWKPELGGFVGTVPLFSEMGSGTVQSMGSVLRMGTVGVYTDVHCLRFEVKAILTENFVTTARLERTIRTRLNIKVIPWYAHSSALAPKGPSFDSLVIGRNGAAAAGAKAEKEAVTSHVQKTANDGAPGLATASGPWNKPVNAPTTLEDREVSKDQEQCSPWPISDLSNYNVSSIFAEHKPYHKSNLTPGSPRKHVDELFKLDMPDDIDFGTGVVTDVQAYHVTGLDSIGRHNPESFWRSGRAGNQLAEIPTTQHIEDVTNITNDSHNSRQPCIVEETDALDIVRSWDDHHGSRETQPAPEGSLELAPAGDTTRYTFIGRNHNGHRAHRSFPTYDEEAGRQETLYFPRSEMGKKDQRRWLDTPLSPIHRSRRRVYSDDATDAADEEYDEFLHPCTEADAVQETHEQPDSGLSFEGEDGGVTAPIRSPPELRSVHPMWQADARKESTDSSSLNAEGDDSDYQSDSQKRTEQSTDAARANHPVALKLWARRSARRARDGKVRARDHPGIIIEMGKRRASRTYEDIDHFADHKLNFDCNTATDREVEVVDYFSDFRSVFNHRVHASHAAEVTDYFADFRHTFEDRQGTNHEAEAVEVFADLRKLIDGGPRYSRAVEPVDHFAQSRWMFGRVPRIDDNHGSSTDYLADFRFAFGDETGSNPRAGDIALFAGSREILNSGPRYGHAVESVHFFAQSRWMFGADHFADFWPTFGDDVRAHRLAEVADEFTPFRRYLDGGRRCDRAADPVHYFAQSRWMFGRNDDEDELPMDYSAGFRSIFDGGDGAEGDDHFAEFWSGFGHALEDVDYFSEFRSIFDCSIGLEDDKLSMDTSVASVADFAPAMAQTPKLLPQITCFFNRYSPLRRISNANIDIESDISLDDDFETIALLQELPNLSPTDYHSTRFHSSSQPSSSSSTQLHHRRAPNHSHDSGYHSGSDHTNAPATTPNYPPPLPPRRPSTPPPDLTYLKPRTRPHPSHSRTTSPSPPSTRATSTFTSSRLPSAALEIVIENDDVDPRLRREQALLWSLLGTRDERLAREERKRVWDVMRIEAGGRGEEGDGEELGGEDFVFGSAGESEGETAGGSEGATTLVEGEEC